MLGATSQMPLPGRQSSPSVTYLLDQPAEREKAQSVSVEGMAASCALAREGEEGEAVSPPMQTVPAIMAQPRTAAPMFLAVYVIFIKTYRIRPKSYTAY